MTTALTFLGLLRAAYASPFSSSEFPVVSEPLSVAGEVVKVETAYRVSHDGRRQCKSVVTFRVDGVYWGSVGDTLTFESSNALVVTSEGTRICSQTGAHWFFEGDCAFLVLWKRPLAGQPVGAAEAGPHFTWVAAYARYLGGDVEMNAQTFASDSYGGRVESVDPATMIRSHRGSTGETLEELVTRMRGFYEMSKP